MEHNTEKNTNILNKIINNNSLFNIGKKLLFVIFFFLIIGIIYWYLLEYQARKVVDEEKKHIPALIHEIIETQVNCDLILPNMLVVNFDSTKKSEFKSTIINQLSEFYIQKYLKKDDKYDYSNIRQYSFPFLKSNKNGDFMVNEKQMYEIKGHIEFLSKQVDKSVYETRQEVSNDINRLNNWMTLWIGIVGFLAVFIPILINFWNREEFREIKDATNDIENKTEKVKKDAEEAKVKSDNAIDIILKHEPSINKIKDIEKTVKELSESTGTSKDNLENAISNADSALKKSKEIEQLLVLINDISNLYIFEPGNIRLIKTTEIITVLIKYLSSLSIGFNRCKNNFNHPIIIDCLSKLSLRMYEISYSSFIISNQHSKSFIDLSKLISETLENELTEEIFNKIIIEINTLIEALKSHN